MKLFVGLGNPGAKYEGNRHNVGFMVLDAIAASHGFPPWRRKFQALITEGDIGRERVMLLKPETFMNDSGRAAGEAMRFLKLDVGSIFAFHDELDLAPGKLKVKAGGGNAGHNGLRSLSAHLGNDYTRIRLGIGHPGSKDAVVHYVLNDFAKSERNWLSGLLDAVAKAAPQLASGDNARFLNDVARATGETEPEPAKRAPKSLRDDTPKDPSQRAHPAGERTGKRQSALAENLKKWLSAKKPDG